MVLRMGSYRAVLLHVPSSETSVMIKTSITKWLQP